MGSLTYWTYFLATHRKALIGIFKTWHRTAQWLLTVPPGSTHNNSTQCPQSAFMHFTQARAPIWSDRVYSALSICFIQHSVYLCLRYAKYRKAGTLIAKIFKHHHHHQAWYFLFLIKLKSYFTDIRKKLFILRKYCIWHKDLLRVTLNWAPNIKCHTSTENNFSANEYLTRYEERKYLTMRCE
jgi:hypothetical protein